MIDFHSFILFAFASLMLNITPGPDILYVISRSAGQGISAGIVSVLGICTGCLVHILAAVFGLSAILMESATAFQVIKWAGAIYLIYIGIQTLRSAGTPLQLQQNGRTMSLWALFRQGVITNVLNPKVAIFFLAFLPQFVQPEHGHVPLQIMLLGIWFDFSGLVVMVLIALLFGRIGNWLSRYPGVIRWQERFTGVILLGLGLRLAFFEKK